MMTNAAVTLPSNQAWLTRYFFVRALISAIWATLALTIGMSDPVLGIALIFAYPAWDALANYVDAAQNGGLRANPTQALNTVASAMVTIAVAIAATRGFHAIIGVIGVWASLAGLLQLATATRRWRHARAQWPMILSGAQSTLAGGIFLTRAGDANLHLSVADVAPYAAFGAAYFAVSAGILALRRRG